MASNIQQQRGQMKIMQYPSNLGSPGSEHYMLFSIKIQEQSKYALEGGGITLQPGTAGAQANPKRANAKVRQGTVATDTAIALYMPETLAFSYQSDYEVFENFASRFLGSSGSPVRVPSDEDEDYAAKLGSGFKDVLQYAGESVTPEKAKQLYLSLQRQAINPHKEQVFSGVPFRTFSFSFSFTPFSQAETDALDQIIKTFKFHMHPELLGDVGSRYFIYPSEFDIAFYSGGEENPYIPKISTCVLTGLDSNLAESGWAAYQDSNAPVSVKLDLKFTELEIMTKERILQGY